MLQIKDIYTKRKGFTPLENAIRFFKRTASAACGDFSQTGFTVVELLVAMSVFTILLSIAIGIFVNGLKSERYLTDLMSVNNNSGIVLEQMAREIRTGYNFALGGDCSSITFVNGQKTSPGASSITSYELEGGKIKRTENNVEGFLTSSEILVKNLCFEIQKYGSTDIARRCSPWRITILMEVDTRDAETNSKTSFVQTTVSSRVLPIEIEGDPYQCRKI